MPLVKVQKRHTLTIPVALRDRVEVGGQVEMTATDDGGIKITPMRVIPERATKRILKLAEQARQGKGVVSFDSVEEFLADLDNPDTE